MSIVLKSWVFFRLQLGLPSLKTNMTMEKQLFEDVSSIKNGDFPMSC